MVDVMTADDLARARALLEAGKIGVVVISHICLRLPSVPERDTINLSIPSHDITDQLKLVGPLSCRLESGLSPDADGSGHIACD